MIRKQKKDLTEYLDEISASVSPIDGQLLPCQLTLFHQQSIANTIERELAIEQELAIANSLIEVLFRTFYSEDEKEELYEDIMAFIWNYDEYYGQEDVIFENIHDRESLMKEILLIFSKGITLELCLNILERELHM